MYIYFFMTVKVLSTVSLQVTVGKLLDTQTGHAIPIYSLIGNAVYLEKHVKCFHSSYYVIKIRDSTNIENKLLCVLM